MPRWSFESDMAATLPKPNGRGEDQRLDRLPMKANGAVQKVDLAMDTAKEHVGKAIGSAIGDEPLRVFGDASFIAKVITGEKAPDYLARIYRNPDARRRLGLALLRGDDKVKVRR